MITVKEYITPKEFDKSSRQVAVVGNFQEGVVSLGEEHVPGGVNQGKVCYKIITIWPSKNYLKVCLGDKEHD
ncbi:MAG: hypothetical protein LBH41_01690 [Rickettsiales bacterium]|jgi:hypothetical protein|nr:hypothetical protein [Rickettsiales bacterium]